MPLTVPNPDATTTTKGKIKLAGDLAGTADSPAVANGVITAEKLATGVADYQYSGFYTDDSGANYITTPDVAALDITGDIDIRMCLTATDWSPASNPRILNKWLTSGDQRSYQIRLATSGALEFWYTTAGTAATSVTVTSSATVPFSASEQGWIRVTRASASGNTIFYTSSDGVTWTQLGTTQSTTGASIFSGTGALEIGNLQGAGAGSRYVGFVHYAEIRSGIGGTIVANPDLRLPSATRLRDDQGLVYTFAGTTWSWGFFLG